MCHGDCHAVIVVYLFFAFSVWTHFALRLFGIRKCLWKPWFLNYCLPFVYQLQVMSQTIVSRPSQSKPVVCPTDSCEYKGTVTRILHHFRQCHAPDEMTREFVAEYNLHQCPYCHQWFQRLLRHTPGCKISHSSSHNEDPQRVPLSSDSFSTDKCERESCVQVETALPVSTSLASNVIENTDSCLPRIKPNSNLSNGSISSAEAMDARAWSLMESLSVNDILSSPVPRTVTRVPNAAVSVFRQCCSIPLERIASDPSDAVAWQHLMLVPRMVLTPPKRGGRAGTQEIRHLCQKFLEYRWEELLQLNIPRSSKESKVSRNHQRNSALRLVCYGELSRAARILCSKGLAPATQATVDKLATKHPLQRQIPEYEEPKPDSLLNLNQQSLSRLIRSAPRGSGNGPSGWRYEHLRALIADRQICDYLHILCSAIASSSPPKQAITLLSASRLVALPKGVNDVRPIAIGEVLRRITAKAICSEKQTDFQSFFCPIQHGVATEGGVETIVHHVQALIEQHPEWVILKSDVKNAFNSISRQHMLQQICNSFPDLYPHAFSMYGHVSSLVYTMGERTVILQSQEGVHQGDPLGPSLFAIAIQPLLFEVQKRHARVQTLAYLDDVFLIGPPKETVNAFQDLQSQFESAELHVSKQKCEA